MERKRKAHTLKFHVADLWQSSSPETSLTLSGMFFFLYFHAPSPSPFLFHEGPPGFLLIAKSWVETSFLDHRVFGEFRGAHSKTRLLPHASWANNSQCSYFHWLQPALGTPIWSDSPNPRKTFASTRFNNVFLRCLALYSWKVLCELFQFKHPLEKNSASLCYSVLAVGHCLHMI